MMPQSINHMFSGLEFKKSSDEIKQSAKTKIEKINSKITEREKRVKDLRAEYQIEDSDLVQLLEAARDSSARMLTYHKMSQETKQMEEKTIGAGVVNNLLTENDFIRNEKGQVKVLERIIRNLEPKIGESGKEQKYKLTPEELDYLEF